MIQKSNKLWLLACMLVVLVTSCADSSAQEVSRSNRNYDISSYSVESSDESVGNTNTSRPENNEVPVFEWGGGPEKRPEKFDFDLSFGENVKVVNYDKKVVNAYRARYGTLLDSWGDYWFKYGFGEIKKWCTGWPLSIFSEDNPKDSAYYLPDYDVSYRNIQNVSIVTLNEIDGFEEISTKLDIDSESKILCWSYDIKNFPHQIADHAFFEAPIDIQTISYARISAQYIDGLPVTGGAANFGCCTYEWNSVIEPSRLADRGIEDSERINPSYSHILSLQRAKYEVTETILSDLPIVDPLTCLDEIKQALLYNPCAVIGNDNILDIWEKEIEVYCLELAYVALDSHPMIYDESEESRLSHELYIVPVWEVYYTISDKTKTYVCSGSLMLNAATGKPLFSENYGHDANPTLFPELSLPG